ncbi:MAG TPA: hypothetical protein VFR47_31725 [Anaerolineales bacterium]|nr:hypothetical protein [Anaerolineales bacterium]
MNLKKTDLVWILPLALVLGAGLSSLQPGNWWIGFASFSFLFLLSLTILQFSYRWSNGGRTLGLILSFAFALRLLVGVSLYVFLPIYGHGDADDKSGFVFTDAHRRDDEAWKLASSDRFILEAFNKKFAYDQYGGLLAFSALVYRYLSPDAHRPLLLALMSAIVAALGIPFLWKAVSQVFGEKVAWAVAWIFALYPESILLGASPMREPYLLMFSAMALYGFVNSGVRELAPATNASKLADSRVAARIWLALSLLGMILVSPAVALATLIIFAGWMWSTTSERGAISWKAILVFAIIFVLGLFFLSASLNRSGEFDSSSPLSVVNDWLKLAVNWNVYRIERESGWIQKLFDEMPEWMRLPFVAIYGILQPVLPATLIKPTELIWKIIYILRALGWYTLLPLLILSFGAGSGPGFAQRRSLIQWLALLTWAWILLAALRGGGDQWDNPRYRTILFLWQAILAGIVWVWWQEARSRWVMRLVACEAAFLIVFTQWYASRYYHWGGQLPFAAMIALIFGLWVIILLAGWWRDRKRVSIP